MGRTTSERNQRPIRLFPIFFPKMHSNYKKCSNFAADLQQPKKHKLWLTKFLTAAQHVVLVWTSARSELFPKATFTKSILMNALNAVLVQALARAKQFLWMSNCKQ